MFILLNYYLSNIFSKILYLNQFNYIYEFNLQVVVRYGVHARLSEKLPRS